jgi:hypothetical protein
MDSGGGDSFSLRGWLDSQALPSRALRLSYMDSAPPRSLPAPSPYQPLLSPEIDITSSRWEMDECRRGILAAENFGVGVVRNEQ